MVPLSPLGVRAAGVMLPANPTLKTISALCLLSVSENRY